MTVNELLNSMTKEFRKSLCDVFIDDNEIEEVDAGTVKSEVDCDFYGNFGVYPDKTFVRLY